MNVITKQIHIYSTNGINILIMKNGLYDLYNVQVEDCLRSSNINIDSFPTPIIRLLLKTIIKKKPL